MSNKVVLLEKYRMSVELSEPPAPLNYIQLRNQEALRTWRRKLAFGSTTPVVPEPSVYMNPGRSLRTHLGEQS